MAVYFLFLLGICTNFNCVTLENNVNVALTAELQFNQNDINELDRVQSYIDEIRKNILRRNFRRYNVDQQYNTKDKAKKLSGNVSIDNSISVNIEKYPNFRKNHVKDTASKIKKRARMKMVNMNVRVGGNSLEDTKNNEKKMKIRRNTVKSTVETQLNKNIHIHETQNKLVIIKTTPKTTKYKTNQYNVTKEISSKSNNLLKTTVGHREFNDNIHIHEVQKKLVIIKTTPENTINSTKDNTEDYEQTTKPIKLNTKTNMPNEQYTITTKYKTSISTKTTVGQEVFRDNIHIHDVQKKLILIETTPQSTENTTIHNTENYENVTKTSVVPNEHKEIKSKPPSARKHRITTNRTLKYKELKTTEADKSKNEVLNSTEHYKKEFKERDQKIDYSSNQTNENFNDLDEYLKYKAKKENYGQNKEVLEKMKSDLSNLFSNDIASPTSEKADSFQELEKAFGFDM